MQGDDLPAGFESGTETRIVATPDFDGYVLTLGSGSTVRGLVVEDVMNRRGNTVGVVSRAPDDSLAASLVECEIVNPNASGAGVEGPVGGGIAVLTRNPLAHAAPPPHVGADVTLRLTRSIVRSAVSGRALFAYQLGVPQDYQPQPRRQRRSRRTSRRRRRLVGR